jgi:hypothetical protein
MTVHVIISVLFLVLTMALLCCYLLLIQALCISGRWATCCIRQHRYGCLLRFALVPWGRRADLPISRSLVLFSINTCAVVYSKKHLKNWRNGTMAGTKTREATRVIL